MSCSANKTTPMLLTYQPLLLAQAQAALLSIYGISVGFTEDDIGFTCV
jgi:hypothetical protein